MNDNHKRESAMTLFGDLNPYIDTDLIQLHVIPQVNSFLMIILPMLEKKSLINFIILVKKSLKIYSKGDF